MGAIKRFYDHIGPTTVSAGTANAHAISYAVAPAAYVAGDVYEFIVGVGLSNTGATTLNINSLGAKDILIAGAALQGGELREAQLIHVGYDGTQFQLLRGITPAFGSFSPSNPTATASAVGVMMGIGSTCTITPKVSGAVKIDIIGGGFNDSAGNTFTVQIRYGTGTAPANAAALTGTALGAAVQIQSDSANAQRGFALTGVAVGLTVGTAYWIDISLARGAGGNATAQNLSVVAIELPR